MIMLAVWSSVPRLLSLCIACIEKLCSMSNGSFTCSRGLTAEDPVRSVGCVVRGGGCERLVGVLADSFKDPKERTCSGRDPIVWVVPPRKKAKLVWKPSPRPIGLRGGDCGEMAGESKSCWIGAEELIDMRFSMPPTRTL